MIQSVDNHPNATEQVGVEISSLTAKLELCIERHAIELNAAQAEMDTFAHSISHDLRSPLTVVVGFADLLAKHSNEALDTRGRHYLERITSSAIEIGRMLDEILALSRMSRSEMHIVRIDLEALVKKIVRDADALKGDHRVIWLIGRLPSIEADPILLRQAIGSLVSNALKFTKSREVARIQIGVRGDDTELEFFVRDNGAALDIKHRERLFGSYQRPHSSSESNGSALGLAYVQRIIQRHGGRTWTEGVPDGGAVFYFSLPGDRAKPLFAPEQ
jgi:light-regulated signal transduction histidine kinase (bacteriophytochrome)